LRACPLPQAADAIVRLEKIDPEAVRRAATLAAFSGPIAGTAAAATAETTLSGQAGDPDGDPGDPGSHPGDPTPAGSTAPTSGDTPFSASGAPASAPETEATIAARIPVVLADEEATDEAPGIDPTRPLASQPTSPAAASPPAATAAKTQPQPVLWKWILWGVVVLLIAIFSRAKLRAGGSGPSIR
jgi:hypothetical protein